jgi:hypothetical protein
MQGKNPFGAAGVSVGFSRRIFTDRRNKRILFFIAPAGWNYIKSGTDSAYHCFYDRFNNLAYTGCYKSFAVGSNQSGIVAALPAYGKNRIGIRLCAAS